MGALQGGMTKNQHLRKASNGVEIATAHIIHRSSNSDSDNHTGYGNTRTTEVEEGGSFFKGSLAEHNHTRVGPAELETQQNVATYNQDQDNEIAVSDESIHSTPEIEIIRASQTDPDQLGLTDILSTLSGSDIDRRQDFVKEVFDFRPGEVLQEIFDNPLTEVFVEDMSMNTPACQIAIQKPAPFFQGQAVVNGEFKEISLEDYKGKYVVLFFYPMDFTFVCPTEIIAFSDRADDFRKIGCELIAASTDSHYSHHAWINSPRKMGGLGEMNIPLLSDKTGAISRKYGVYKEDEGIAYRGLFIIDGKQILRQITINDLPVGRSVDETLRLVQAFQFTDKHGEVCPAGWKPGAKTIKPSVRESKAYFENTGN